MSSRKSPTRNPSVRNSPAVVPLAPPLVGATGVAALLGIGRETVRKMKLAGELGPCARLVRRRFWSVEELRERVRAGMPHREKCAEIRKAQAR